MRQLVILDWNSFGCFISNKAKLLTRASHTVYNNNLVIPTVCEHQKPVSTSPRPAIKEVSQTRQAGSVSPQYSPGINRLW